MNNIGMLYIKPVIVKQVKEHVVNQTGILWDDVYSVNIKHIKDKPAVLVLGDRYFKTLKEIPVSDIFGDGWKAKKKSWWRF